MKDYLGNELQVGDKVVYLQFNRTSAQFHEGTVESFTPQKVYVRGPWGRRLKEAYHVVKVGGVSNE